MPAENTNNVWLIGSRVGHQVRCLTPSMLQDLSAMEHNQNSCSSHQSVTTTQWVWHQVLELASSCFLGRRMVFPLVVNPQSENIMFCPKSLNWPGLTLPLQRESVIRGNTVDALSTSENSSEVSTNNAKVKCPSPVWANLLLFSTTSVRTCSKVLEVDRALSLQG